MSIILIPIPIPIPRPILVSGGNASMYNNKKWIWLIVPGLSGFMLFYVIPFIYSFYYTVIDNTFNKQFVGLSNFIGILQNKYYLLALKNTFEFTLIGVPVLVLISFVLAAMMVSFARKMQLVKAAFVIPVLLPSAAVVMIWQVIFGENGSFMGFMNAIAGGADNSILQKIPIFLFYFWKNAGFNMILFIAGLISIPGEIYEAGNIDGAGVLKKHLHITFPLLMPTTFFVLVLSTVNSFRIFKEVYLLYGSYPQEALYIVQHYMNNHFNKLNYQNLATGAVIFALIVYLLIALSYRYENRANKGVW